MSFLCTSLNTALQKHRSSEPISIEEHELKVLEIIELQKENKELREVCSLTSHLLLSFQYQVNRVLDALNFQVTFSMFIPSLY